MYKIFVFSANRFDTITTSPALEAEGIDHFVMCHTQEQCDGYAAGGRVRPERLIVGDERRGLAYNRNAALERMQDGEWAIFLVDDLIRLTEIDDYDSRHQPTIPISAGNSTEWNRRFNNAITATKFIQRCGELIRFCEQVNSHLGGFAAYGNPFFRAKHWMFNVLADGRALVVRRTRLRFDTNVHLIDDYAWSLLNISVFGSVVVNQWVLPEFHRLSAKMFCASAERVYQKKRECAYLTAKFPRLVSIAEKPGWPTGSHIRIRAPRSSKAQVAV